MSEARSVKDYVFLLPSLFDAIISINNYIKLSEVKIC